MTKKAEIDKTVVCIIRGLYYLGYGVEISVRAVISVVVLYLTALIFQSADKSTEILRCIGILMIYWVMIPYFKLCVDLFKEKEDKKDGGTRDSTS